MTDHDVTRLSTKSLTSSAFWSLAAQAIPAVAGVIAIPLILRGLGVERFGVLTLAWMVIGYFSLLDLGMGRAVTKFAAQLLVSSDQSSMNRLIWTAWYLMFGLGITGALGLAAIVPWLVGAAMHVPPDLRRETTGTFYLLACSIPLGVVGCLPPSEDASR